MNKLSQKIEFVANILIIAAILLSGGIIQKYFSISHTLIEQVRVRPTIGSKLNLQDVNFLTQPKTLVLALQTGCRFCNESAPFYKRIVETIKDKNIKLVAAFPTNVEESAAHLNELGLANIEVRRSSLNDIQVSGTPTLILTNEKGEVTDFWVGKLTPDK